MPINKLVIGASNDWLNQSFEAIFAAMLPVAGSLMGKSTIAATEHYVEPCALYTIICEFQSSKKSVCIDLFKSNFSEAMDAVEALLNEKDFKEDTNRLNNSEFCFVCLCS